MQDLLGRTFSVADGKYRVVDVRNLNGDAMVYAEALPADEAAAKARPRRMAFHYADIAELVESGNKIA